MSIGPADEKPLSVVQSKGGTFPHAGGGAPRAKVFAWPNRKRSKAQIKRDRFVHNLRGQYRQLKESLAATKHFFVISGVGKTHIAAVHKAHTAALEDLSTRFQLKINEYDRRIKGGA